MCFLGAGANEIVNMDYSVPWHRNSGVKIKMSEDRNQLSTERENERLILFPASKNYPPVSREGSLDDPLQELLDEFSHLSDDDVEDETKDLASAGLSLEEHLKSEGEDYLAGQVRLLEEIMERMNFYVSEIELYLRKA